MRGRNRSNKGPNPLTRSYESNGPDVKIRGTAQHVAEKYSQLARDAQASGDPVAAENYFQHAEHYIRLIAAAQEQLREQFGYQPRPFDDEGDEEGSFGEDGDFGSQQQPFDGRPEGRQDGRQDGRPDNRQDNRQDNRTDNRQDGDRERPQRFDNRQDRGGERQSDRFESRSERQGGERSENRGERQDRGDRRDRFNRPDRPRQDFQPRDDRGPPRDGDRNQQPRGDRPFRGDDRQDRGEPRGEFRRGPDRDRRRDEPDAAEAPGLPAFLTNPVRPVLGTEAEDAAPAVDNGVDAAAEGNGDYRLRRRRGRGRGRGFGDETGAEPAADFTPEVEVPPAE